MTTWSRRLGPLSALALITACGAESDHLVYGVQAHSFANSEWSAVVHLVDISSNVADVGPTLSTDGLSLYFSSNRAQGFGGNDLWVARRACAECSFGPPANLGPVVNSAAIENRPALSGDGHLLFFFSDRPNGHGATDIWVSRRADPKDDFGWEPPVNLGPGVNTADAEQAPFYLQSAEDGIGNLYFARGAVGAAAQDIYVATVTRDGATRGVAVIVSELNVAAANDAGPSMRADGRELFFHSLRSGQSDLYRSTRQSVHEPWSLLENLEALNTTAFEQQPSLSHDGRTLLWTSNRPGSLLNPSGVPSFDIYMATRTPSGN